MRRIAYWYHLHYIKPNCTCNVYNCIVEMRLSEAREGQKDKGVEEKTLNTLCEIFKGFQSVSEQPTIQGQARCRHICEDEGAVEHGQQPKVYRVGIRFELGKSPCSF